MPTDTAKDKLILTAHMYYNYHFTQDISDSPTDVFDDTSKNDMKNGCKALYDNYVSKGIGVVIGEYGAIDRNNSSDRVAYYKYQVKTAYDYGICCVVWDNNAFLASKASYTTSDFKDTFGLFDRSNGTIKQKKIIDAIMSALK